MQERINRLENLVLEAIVSILLSIRCPFQIIVTRSWKNVESPHALKRSRWSEEAMLTLHFAQGSKNGSSQSPQSNTYSTAAPEDTQSDRAKAEESLPAIGVLEIKDPKRCLYSGSTAWNGILHEINDLKSFCSETKDTLGYHDVESRELDSRVRPLLGLKHSIGQAPIEPTELAMSLPPREIMDKLVGLFFKVYDPSMPVSYIVHQPTFMEEYRVHLENPKALCNIWLCGLYSMLCISVNFWQSDSNLPAIYQDSPQEWAEYYHQLAAKSLAHGDVTNTLKGTLESCIHFLHAGLVRNKNDITRTWLTAGDILRLAMRMGYHRDPSQYLHLSPLEGELRRRVFQFVYQTDLLCSFQIGLTPAIRKVESDTKPANNYHENQLTPTMASLPTPLDDSEVTFYGYFVAQNRLFRVFGSIVERLNALNTLAYTEVLDLDNQLEDAFGRIPPHLRRVIPDSTADEPRLVLQRIELEIFKSKASCALHRRFMGSSRSNTDYERSRQACIDSALRILSCQTALHANERWPHVEWWTSSFRVHDFILAGTVLCLYLSKRKAEEPDEKVQRVQQALVTSHSIWSDVHDTSLDAGRAFAILNKMRVGLGGQRDSATHQGSMFGSMRPINAETGQPAEVDVNEKITQDPVFGFDAGTADLPIEIDWGAWDSYFRNIEPLEFSQPLGNNPFTHE